jgi:hypothetical protein
MKNQNSNFRSGLWKHCKNQKNKIKKQLLQNFQTDRNQCKKHMTHWKKITIQPLPTTHLLESPTNRNKIRFPQSLSTCRISAEKRSLTTKSPKKKRSKFKQRFQEGAEEEQEEEGRRSWNLRDDAESPLKFQPQKNTTSLRTGRWL